MHKLVAHAHRPRPCCAFDHNSHALTKLLFSRKIDWGDWRMNHHPADVHGFSVDLENAKPFETVFPEKIVDFHTRLNFTANEEDVFQLMVDLSGQCGFCGVIYEFCPDIFAPQPDHFMRTSLPESFLDLERLASIRTKPGYGRAHCLVKWTPAVSGLEFADYFADYPTQVWKFRLSNMITGLRSGFGIPLRSANSKSRAGFAFASKMRRDEFEVAFRKHGWALHAAAWAAHIRILQHASERNTAPRLTDRQLTYLHLLAEGLLDKQIAHELNISHSAVRKHQYAVAKRLGVDRRGEIVPTAIRLGLIHSTTAEKQVDANWNMKLA